MTYVLFGALLLLGLYLATIGMMRAFARAEPRAVAAAFRWAGGAAAALIALALILTGRGGVVVGLAAVAAPYLLARWRSGPGGAQGDRPRQAPPGRSSSGMTREEAYAVLGLAPGAGEAEIRAAHRRLMKACHPDHGGSDALAARVNQAKDVLLG